MFTDSPATPTRVEVLLELVWAMRQRNLNREAIRKFLQPKGLPGLSPNSQQSLDTLNAARDLGLVEEDADGSFRPKWDVREPFVAKALLLTAMDEKVLSSTKIEPWMARFYSYAITKDNDVIGPGKDAGIRWAEAFNQDVFGGVPADNPFNQTKYTGLRRWMRYVGWGWHDSENNFIPSPYERVKRKLLDIFGEKKRQTSDEFMANLAVHCPELDGGEIFREVNKGLGLDKTCSRALAMVLRDLHDDSVVKLDCPADSRGWSLIKAGVIRNPKENLHSDIFDHIALMSQS